MSVAVGSHSKDDSKHKKKKANVTSSARLSLLSTLQDLVLEFFGAVLVLLVAFLTQFSDASEKVVDILGGVGGVGGRSHGRTRASPALIQKKRKEEEFRGINQARVGKRNEKQRTHSPDVR